ncbi:glycoside hydrolase family 16 protein [Vibrio sp. JC009]|uniref:glycoside hydrolase family 16 protein n=1 Tax=Vibrio sp. JC009 TaxID=2912314 RepID=UPI0023AF0390|nr:glycoside hydrolase family 16 protein [Vibrio sp. JC009]WED23883.1 glycoside hydrolase family 16 protein [Vibrio sp. JC009]
MKTTVIKPKYLACAISSLVLAGCSTPEQVIVDQSAQFTPDTNIIENKNGWALVWNDEFDGTEIDPAKWQHETNCWGGGNQEQQCYTKKAKNSFVSNGFLTIRALKGKTTGPAVPDDRDGYDTQKASLPYSSARLRTKNLAEWKYGRFEIRAKLPQGQGTWPAIWMLPTDYVYGGWAASGEIDIMEAVNLHTTYKNDDGETKKENRIHGTLHFGKNWPDNVSSGVSYNFADENINPADSFHTYAIEWEKGEMRWYVDDVHFATQTMDGWWTHYKDEKGNLVQGPEDAPYNQKFHMLLNLAIGGSWAANTNDKGIDTSLKQADMLVDFVRVYQCENAPETGKGCASNLSDSAVQNKGVEEPPLIVKKADVNAATLSVMKGPKLEESFLLNGWDDSSNDSRSVTEDGLEIRIVGAGNAYIEAPGGTLDMSNFEDGELMFDLQVIDGNADALTVKMDSGWPNVAPINIKDLPQQGNWKSYRMKVKDFVAASSAFDITSVVNPVVFEPVNGKKLHFKVKNIRFNK